MSFLSKNPRSVQKRDFQCEVCGNVQPATKRRGTTAPGHKKKMWCAYCKRASQFVQLGNYETGVETETENSAKDKRRKDQEIKYAAYKEMLLAEDKGVSA